MIAGLPGTWTRTPSKTLEYATHRTREVLNAADVTERVAAYYRRESNYAGATFSELNPNDPFSIGGSDLLAVHLLSVNIPQIAVRRLTEPCATSVQLSRLLSSDNLRADLNLQTAGPETLEAMSEFYEGVKAALRPVGARSSNARVTASKLCARKRPDLFPIRDKRVLKLLGTWDLRSYAADWQVFCHLLSDDELMTTLRDIVDDAAAKEGVSVGDPNGLLRHLDVALWTSTLG